MLVALWMASACTETFWSPGKVEGAESVAGEPDDTGTENDSAEEDTVDDSEAEAEAERLYQALFDLATIKEVRVTIGPESRAALDVDPRTYVPASVVVEGTPFEEVGVRLKGSSTYRPLGDKPSIKIRFDAFVEDSRYATLKRLTLNNMVDDPAQAREVIAYHLWNEAEMVAPRATFAHLWVNDLDYGLYTLLEPMDSQYLERRYTMDEGNLYEANDSANLTATGLTYFDLATGPGGTDLADAVAVLDATTSNFYEEASEVVDLEQFMDYYAWMNMVGADDGYPFHLNDYFLYSDPADGMRMDISPWGLDEAWSPAWTLQWGWASTVPHRCLADAACRDMADARFEAALATLEGAGADVLAAQLYELTEDVVLTDPRRPYTPGEVENARSDLSAMLVEWPDAIRRGWWIEPVPDPVP